jgi:N-acetylglucosamine kinase-like BadF-type ATPase
LCVGIDAGGSRTVALAGTPSLAVLGRGESGPGNPLAVGVVAAAEAIAVAATAALVQAEASALDAPSWVIGAAGASHPSEAGRLGRHVAARLRLPAGVVRIVHDLELILPAASTSWGIALVAGTGSSAYARAPNGRSSMAGGWGYLIGDDGSAYALGRRALRVIAATSDHQTPATPLTDSVMRALGASAPRDLIPSIYRSTDPRSAIAALAPVVVASAYAGDPAAQEMMSAAARALADLAVSLARRIELPPEAPVVCSGGLFKAGEVLLRPLRQMLAAAGLAAPQVLETEPARGALRLAAG